MTCTDTKPLVFVTGNMNKLRELREMMGTDIAIDSISLDLPEYQGEPMDIASKKCRAAYEIVRSPVIVEDVCLCFNALGGMPGPYVKWFLEKIGPSGLYRMLLGFDDKSAYAQCIYAYYDGSSMTEPVLFNGICHGSIVQPVGSQKFGWDPCFKPDGFEQTYAEMDQLIKHSISHRGRSFKLLKEYLINSKLR